ncbi:hypothetical protein [Streptomyces sp. G-G2]|uniref:hypothetical protein n=1 Tax=Streptomyces sp. G-G2 TaxID=3046201 RepID=UPI0024BBA826|nr:hypothetical protein [Streptomyces sp. G-G2]MDJ0380731.1 hypothetical protein [Streptomyces sp. G-G2]
MTQEPEVTVIWTAGESTVRWRGGDGGAVVEKHHPKPPQSVMTWTRDGETLVLVVEALDTKPFTPKDNAVVYRADGTERLRLSPPEGLLSDPNAVFGFYSAFPDSEGLPLLVIATRSGDFQSRLDLEAGVVRDARTWR